VTSSKPKDINRQDLIKIAAELFKLTTIKIVACGFWNVE
jgi:hypothetical protein